MRLDVDIKSEFFTSREVADGLGISLRTLKNYRDEGRIQYHKFSPLFVLHERTRKEIVAERHRQI